MDPFWNSIVFTVGETRHWQIGFLEFWVKRNEGEWRVWQQISEDSADRERWSLGKVSEEPEEIDYVRFALDGGDDTLVIEPAFPDRSIVSHPTSPIEVPAGKEALFICSLPLWVKLSSSSEQGQTPLTVFPSVSLSRTWFGTALEGEACYAAETRAVRNFRDLSENKHRVLCPVTVTNRTKSSLPIERICLHVEHLQLFEGDSYLWSNDIFVRKLSDDETSQVTYGRGAPQLEPSSRQVLAPRIPPPQNSLLLRTFNHLRSFMADQ